MKKSIFYKRLTVLSLVAALWILPLAAISQTQIIAPKNKYPVNTDVTEGNKAASQVEKQFPILNDADATAYVTRVGQSLVAAIPARFNQPAFNYRFKIVNARDINAFALPGGPMFVDRGMIEAAHNEGEMAGVMAHEISHVALRHATAQATEQSKLKNQLGVIGLILGGAVVGGQAGAQLGAAGAAAWMTKYSRAYETQADTLGSQIMAAAGYDPHDLANVFKTIQQQEGGRGAPEWLSDHPDPGNRIQNIDREATRLNVSPNPIKITRDFERVQARLRVMPHARSLAEIQKDVQKGGGTTQNPATSSARYSGTVQTPSSRVRTYSGMSGVRINVPSNWRDLASGGDVQFAPDGAYGDQGITHGVMIGSYSGRNNDLTRDSQDYVSELLQGNSYLRQRGSLSQAYFAGRKGYTAVLAGRSPITGRTEVVTIYTAGLRNGSLFYFATVVPDNESQDYSSAFRNMLSSIRLND